MQGIGIYGEDFLRIKKDEELVKENIKRILTTVPGEQAGNLRFGSRVREYLFNFKSILLEDLEQVIVSSIITWEQRVNILDVSIEVDERTQEKINVVLDLQLKENLDEFNLSIPIVF